LVCLVGQVREISNKGGQKKPNLKSLVVINHVVFKGEKGGQKIRKRHSVWRKSTST